MKGRLNFAVAGSELTSLTPGDAGIYISMCSYCTKVGVEFYHLMRNVSNSSEVWLTENLNTLFLLSLCLPCYMRDKA